MTSRRMTLKPLLESADGAHLTLYLVNRGKLIDLKAQLRQSIDQAYKWLIPVMSAEELNKFFEPLNTLFLDTRILREMRGNVGIFRNQDSFRVLNIPVEVEQTCQVATSFHVKPLLRWLQTDQEFLILGLEAEAAHIYLGSQDSLQLIDSILFPESFNDTSVSGDYLSLKQARFQKLKQDEVFVWLSDLIAQLTQGASPKLFLAGEKYLIDGVKRNLKYKNAVTTPVVNLFRKEMIGDVCSVVRRTLRADSKAALEKVLMEFRFAEESNKARKNLFQISRAVVQGRVRKLLVSDEICIFGKIDKKSGGLAIHPCDLDHEDDDILDDLSQMVLRQGGEVIVASKNEIPNGRAILAILDEGENEMANADAFPQTAIFQERIR